MAGRPRVSVCMATYCGAAHVVDQLTSILVQLAPDDEVVVVDDGSTDGTVGLVEGLGDPRVVVLRQPANTGHVAAFGRALAHANGDVLVLADQDDLWPAGRLDAMLEGLDGGWVVAGNVAPFGDSAVVPARRLNAADSQRRLANLAGILLGRRPYFGSAMALRAPVRRYLLPIPRYVESHDVFLALLATLAGRMVHLDQVVTDRRVHGANLSTPTRRAWPVLVRSRVDMVRALATLAARLVRGGRLSDG